MQEPSGATCHMAMPELGPELTKKNKALEKNATATGERFEVHFHGI